MIRGPKRCHVIVDQVEGCVGVASTELQPSKEALQPFSRQRMVEGLGIAPEDERVSLFRLQILGLGAQPPTPEWGAMLADGREFMMDAWWIASFPGLALMITVFGFSFFGDALSNALDPKMERRLR